MSQPRKQNKQQSIVAASVVLSMLVQLMFPLYSHAATVTVAPNLMIILGTSNSMNGTLGTAGTISNPQIFNDQQVISYPGNSNGNQSWSKLYAAKQAITSVLTDPMSNNVNVGFATYKMIYGMQMGAGLEVSTEFDPIIYPVDLTYNNTNYPGTSAVANTVLTAYGSDLTHFVAVDWWPFYMDVVGVGGPSKNGNKRFVAAASKGCGAILSNASGTPLFPSSPPQQESAFLGNGFCDGGMGVIVDTLANPANWLTATSNPYPNTSNQLGALSSGGLPQVVQVPPTDTSGSSMIDGDNYYTGYPHSTVMVRGLQGVTGSYTRTSPAMTIITSYLCTTYYSPGNNQYQARYFSYIPYPPQKHGDGAMVSDLGPGTPYRIDFTTGAFPVINDANIPCSPDLTDTASAFPGHSNLTMPNGAIVSVSAGNALYYDQRQVDGETQAGKNWQQYGGQWKAPANIAGRPTLTVEAGYYNLATADAAYGSLSGWSGETSYQCTNTTTNTVDTSGKCANPAAPGFAEQVVALYPSGGADPNGSARKLVTDGWIRPALSYNPTVNNNVATVTTTYNPVVNHMGPFLDLPVTAYTDNRPTILGLLGTTQMRDDGTDYNPATHTMAAVAPGTTTANSDSANYGVSAGAHSGGGDNPIYDTLNDAYAYFVAYRAADHYKNCRINNVMLVIDGGDHGRYYLDAAGNTNFVDGSSNIATKLQSIGVNVYVVLINSATNSTATNTANAIAANGGTGSAYVVTNATSLLTALQNIFHGLSGETNQAPLAAPLNSTGSGSTIYAAINDAVNPNLGHLEAFSVNGQGLPSSTASWDAATLTTVATRTADIYSTNDSHVLTLLTGMDNAAFGSPAVSVSTQNALVNAVIDPPSYTNALIASSPPYMGQINGLQSPVLANPPDNPALVVDPTYVTYAQAEQASFTPQILFSTNEGLLYSIYQSTGQLNWAWMPREFVDLLQNTGYISDPLGGDGASTVVDAKTGSTWASYVLGTMGKGQSNYALKLDANGRINGVVFDDYRSNGAVSVVSPPVLLTLTTTGTPTTTTNYALFASNADTTNTANIPTLIIYNLGTGAVAANVLIGFSPTSNFFVMNNTLFLGDASGNVYTAQLATSGVLNNPILINPIGSFFQAGAADSDHKIQYIGGLMIGSTPYIYAQSTTRISVFDQASPPAWGRLWTSSTVGAGTGQGSSYTHSTVGYSAPTTAVVSSAGVQWLPPSGLITGNSAIVNGALIVPVEDTGSSSVSSCSSGNAYEFLFNLQTGLFPAGVFTSNATPSPTAITTNIAIGDGRSFTSSFTARSNSISVFSSSAQSTKGAATGVGATTTGGMSSALMGNRIIWWQLLNN